MRQRFSISCLVIGCVLLLAACGQPASVGIPTPELGTTVTAQPATALAVPPTTTPAPPPPPPTNTPAPPAPPPTETATEPTPVPPESEPPTPAPAQAAPRNVACNQQVTHIVRPGDNLFRIALRYKTTIYAIARRNGITNSRVIHTGQRLRIVTCARGNSAPSRSGGGTYVVKRGDNMFRIALRFGTTIQRIMAANGCYSTIIVPGQVLIIPS